MNAKWTVLSVSLVAICLAGSAFAAVERLRVYTARPDAFEFMFASIAAGSATAVPLLSFNNLRTGRTTFAKVGEKVGDYRIKSFEPKSETVFNESINKQEVRKGGVVVLIAPTGQIVTLEMGRPLPNEQFVAWVVDLDTGNGAQVRPGDSVSLGGVTQRVDGVSPEQVCVSVDGEPRFLGLATDAERAELGAVWAKQREAWEETKRRSDERARKDAEAREQEAIRTAFEASAIQSVQRPAPVRRPAGSQMSVVTEYRYPTEYEVIPPMYDSRGNMIRPLFVIPKHFVTRPVGVSVNSGTPDQVIQDSRGTGGTTTSVTGSR